MSARTRLRGRPKAKDPDLPQPTAPSPTCSGRAAPHEAGKSQSSKAEPRIEKSFLSSDEASLISADKDSFRMERDPVALAVEDHSAKTERPDGMLGLDHLPAVLRRRRDGIVQASAGV